MSKSNGNSAFPTTGIEVIDDFLQSNEAKWLENVPAWGASAVLTAPIIIVAVQRPRFPNIKSLISHE